MSRIYKYIKSSATTTKKVSCRHPQKHQDTELKPLWDQGQKVIKSSLLALVLSTSGANARKSSNRASWNWFCQLLEPRPESHQIELPGTGFVDFWSQGQKSSNRPSWDWFYRLLEPRTDIKSSLLGLDFSTSGAKSRKSSNRASWDWFSRLLEPRPESHQIKPLGLVLSTSGTKPRKSSNRASWDWFCQLLAS